jgi:hypothetical protein
MIVFLTSNTHDCTQIICSMKPIPFLFILFIGCQSKGQTPNNSLNNALIIGQFALEKLEISQEFDSNLVRRPPLKWSLYTAQGLSNKLIINEKMEFNNELSFQGFIQNSHGGQLNMSNDTLYIRQGFLFTQDSLTIEQLTADRLVLIEAFKMRCVRRTFRRI